MSVNPLISIGTTANATNLTSYATDGAFVAAKGSPAADGDFYYNTADDVIRLHANSTWVSLVGDTITQTLTNKTLTSPTINTPSIKYPVLASQTGTATLTSSDYFVPCSAGSAFTVNLPAASGLTGKKYSIKKTDSSFNAVTIDANSSETIDGATTTTLNTQYESVELICDGSNWHIEKRTIPNTPVSYTPSWGAGLGTPTNVEIWYQRRGNFLRVYGRFSTGTTAASAATMSLPSGLTIGSTGWPTVIAGCGYWYLGTATGSAHKFGSVLATASGSTVSFSVSDFSQAVSPLVAQNGNAIFLSSSQIHVDFQVPISGWSA